MLHIENGKVVRARVDRATACFYEGTRRIVMIADAADFEAGQAALDELRAHIEGRS